MQCIDVYNDYMLLDSLTGHYILTEKALTDYCAIDLRAELAETQAAAPDVQINALCRRVSQLVYNVLHDGVMTGMEKLQSCAIMNIPEARSKLFRALCAQATFMRYNGDQKLAMDKSMRMLAIDDTVYSILEEDVCALGHSLLYAGCW